jgi:hypothetical protein
MGWRVPSVQRKRQDWEVALRWIDKKRAMISTAEIIAFQ